MKKIFSILLLIVVSCFLFPGVSSAQARPFGGKILYTDYCTCSGMNKLILYAPVLGNMPKLLSFRPPASRLYAYSNMEVGAEILGTTASPDTCMKYYGNHCRPHALVAANGAPWLISIVGTSGLGGSPSPSPSPTPTPTPTPTPEPEPEPEPEPTPTDKTCTGISSADLMAMKYIIANEGWRNSSYPDPSGKGRDIGVGHFITGEEPFDVSGTITDEQVGQLLCADYKRLKADSVARSKGVDWNSLSAQRQAVLSDISFSMGAGGISGFTEMWKGIVAKDWVKAGYEITNSDYGRSPATEGRAIRNATVMKSDKPNMINEKINSEPHARNFNG